MPPLERMLLPRFQPQASSRCRLSELALWQYLLPSGLALRPASGQPGLLSGCLPPPAPGLALVPLPWVIPLQAGPRHLRTQPAVFQKRRRKDD